MGPGDPTYGSTTGTQEKKSGVETARDTVRDTADDFSRDASRLADQARDSVRGGVEGARREATRQADRGIQQTADEVAHTARALETAASEFTEGSLQHQLLHRAADGLTELSGTLRGKSIGDVAADLADFGRRNPAAFLGGAALVGFAVARFARASRHPGHYGESHYGPTVGRGGPSGGAYGGAPGAGMTRPISSTMGGPATPVAGPAATGTTTGASPTSPSGPGVRPTGPATGSTGGGSASALGSDPLNKGKPNV